MEPITKFPLESQYNLYCSIRKAENDRNFSVYSTLIECTGLDRTTGNFRDWFINMSIYGFERELNCE